MNYKAELREVADYIGAVRSLYIQIDSDKRTGNSQALYEAIGNTVNIIEIFLTKKGEFSLNERATLLGISRYHENLFERHAVIEIYKLAGVDLMPRKQYIYECEARHSSLTISRLVPSYESGRLYEYETLYILTLPTLHSIIFDVINFAMNYRIIMSFLPPECLKNLEMRMKIVFGDAVWTIMKK